MSVLAPVLVGLFCLLVAVALTALVTSHVVRHRENFTPQPEPYPEVVQEPEPEPEAQSAGPNPIDPANPPYYSLYRPKGGYDPDRAPKCTCHGQRLVEGEKVLIWPIPGHPDGAYDLFCAQTYGVMNP